MTLPATIRDALVFQVAWFACVAGGNAGALAAALVLLPLQAVWPGRRDRREWGLVGLFSAVGLAMDLGWQAIGLLDFSGDLLGPLPFWLAMLWVFFSGTLLRSLAFLQQRLLLAALLGAVAGPLSYWIGMRLGAATSVNAPLQVALAMAPAWALLLPLLAWLSRPRLGEVETA